MIAVLVLSIVLESHVGERPAEADPVLRTVTTELEARGWKHGRALARGMQGLSIRMARRLNRLWRRSGKVFADRFHVEVLRTPRQVRDARALVPATLTLPHS